MLYVFRTVIRRLPGVVIKAVPLPKPEVISGFGIRNEIGKLCKNNGLKKVLLVTDKTVFSLGLQVKIENSLKENGIDYVVFSDISSEPNLTIIDGGRKKLIESNASAIIALGGGAVMDSVKMIAVGGRLKKRKSKSLSHKFLLVRRKSLPIIAVPTTAGTGAEITVGAVVTNDKGSKCSTVIVGLDVRAVILDSELTLKAPKSITCACGIDALSHGLEGVVASVNVSKEDLQKSMECVKLAMENLPLLINDSTNVIARQNMCLCAHYGGNAINKQLAGYVHAVAHSIGAKYHIPHGNAIALSLIPVMDCQREKCLGKLAQLSRYCGFSASKDSDNEACDKFLGELRKLIGLCGFEKKQTIPKEDYKSIARAVALDSINYSAPMVLSNKQIYAILDEINQ